MEPRTEFRDAVASPALEQGTGAVPGTWETIKRALVRAVFWPYERGSWQYDIICLVILLFIFLTPAAWYHDQPRLELTDLRHSQGIVEAGRSKDGWRYIVDARLVGSLGPMKPEDALQQIFSRRLHKPFSIKSVDVVHDRNNIVLGYAVVISR